MVQAAMVHFLSIALNLCLIGTALGQDACTTSAGSNETLCAKLNQTGQNCSWSANQSLCMSIYGTMPVTGQPHWNSSNRSEDNSSQTHSTDEASGEARPVAGNSSTADS